MRNEPLLNARGVGKSYATGGRTVEHAHHLVPRLADGAVGQGAARVAIQMLF